MGSLLPPLGSVFKLMFSGLVASLKLKQESCNMVLFCFAQNHFLLERDIVHTEEIISLIKFDVLFPQQ